MPPHDGLQDLKDVKLDVTERTAYNVIALPVYNDMTDEECDLIVAALHYVHQSALGASKP